MLLNFKYIRFRVKMFTIFVVCATVFSLICCLQHLFLCQSTIEGTTDENKVEFRHMIDEDFKPAIFGSYKYDPIKQEFDDVTEYTISPFVNVSYVLSTIGYLDLENTTDSNNIMRKIHLSPVTVRNQMWWLRADEQKASPKPGHVTKSNFSKNE